MFASDRSGHAAQMFDRMWQEEYGWRDPITRVKTSSLRSAG
jgi:hypothetical protein